MVAEHLILALSILTAHQPLIAAMVGEDLAVLVEVQVSAVALVAVSEEVASAEAVQGEAGNS